MDLFGEYRIAAPRERVWAVLTDPDQLGQCIPAAEMVTRLSDSEIAVAVPLTPGGASPHFTGRVMLSDRMPPSRCTISGSVNAADGASSVSGRSLLTLAEDGPSGTVLTYEASIEVAGSWATSDLQHFGEAARARMDEFAACLAAAVAPGRPFVTGDPDDPDDAATELLVETAEEMEARPEVPSSGMPQFASVPLTGRPDLASSDEEAAALARLAEPHHSLDEPETPVAAPASRGLGPVGWVALVVVVLLVMVLLTTLG